LRKYTLVSPGCAWFQRGRTAELCLIESCYCSLSPICSCCRQLGHGSVRLQVNVGLPRYRYPLEDGSGEIVVATTRPETMLGDTAVAIHPEDPRCMGTTAEWASGVLSQREVSALSSQVLALHEELDVLRLAAGIASSRMAAAVPEHNHCRDLYLSDVFHARPSDVCSITDTWAGLSGRARSPTHPRCIVSRVPSGSGTRTCMASLWCTRWTAGASRSSAMRSWWT
jgi:hypothetical protein